MGQWTGHDPERNATLSGACVLYVLVWRLGLPRGGRRARLAPSPRDPRQGRLTGAPCGWPDRHSAFVPIDPDRPGGPDDNAPTAVGRTRAGRAYVPYLSRKRRQIAVYRGGQSEIRMPRFRKPGVIKVSKSTAVWSEQPSASSQSPSLPPFPLKPRPGLMVRATRYFCCFGRDRLRTKTSSYRALARLA
jgi:hypothetical protein